MRGIPSEILIDGRTRAELMIDYGLGTTSTAKREIRVVYEVPDRRKFIAECSKWDKYLWRGRTVRLG